MGHRFADERDSMMGIATFRWASDFFLRGGLCVRISNNPLPGPRYLHRHVNYVHQCLDHLLWWFNLEIREDVVFFP